MIEYEEKRRRKEEEDVKRIFFFNFISSIVVVTVVASRHITRFKSLSGFDIAARGMARRAIIKKKM